jgi:hypothetical protein
VRVCLRVCVNVVQLMEDRCIGEISTLQYFRMASRDETYGKGGCNIEINFR